MALKTIKDVKEDLLPMLDGFNEKLALLKQTFATERHEAALEEAKKKLQLINDYLIELDN